MSTFSCGGGSSLGYKLAGCEVIAANDIDPEMQAHYVRNLHPKHYFLCPIGELLTRELPGELFHLDILDGSPPCSTFSMSGDREKAWGKEKHFREGQTAQVLSDLFFDYLRLVERLRPKVAIAENVKGILAGNAKGYVKLIVEEFRRIGYKVQVFQLNAADCGVPQTRERVFFCALRNDIQAPPLVLAPHTRWISASEACSDVENLTAVEREQTASTPTDALFWAGTAPGESYKHECLRQRGKSSFFNHQKLHPGRPAPTLTSNCHTLSHWSECRKLSLREMIRLASFPDDYTFDGYTIGRYLVGMSVPPKLMQYVAGEVCRQWLKV